MQVIVDWLRAQTKVQIFTGHSSVLLLFFHFFLLFIDLRLSQVDFPFLANLVLWNSVCISYLFMLPYFFDLRPLQVDLSSFSQIGWLLFCVYSIFFPVLSSFLTCGRRKLIP